jgi:CRISPR system Cascade subunit CasC
MMGVTEFVSACYYRYIALDLRQFRRNLQDDQELIEKGLLAFSKAAVQAVPGGKQNAFAAHNPPSFCGPSLRPSAYTGEYGERF